MPHRIVGGPPADEYWELPPNTIIGWPYYSILNVTYREEKLRIVGAQKASISPRVDLLRLVESFKKLNIHI